MSGLQPRQVDEAIPLIVAAMQSGDPDPVVMCDRLACVAVFKAAAIARRTLPPDESLNLTLAHSD